MGMAAGYRLEVIFFTALAVLQGVSSGNTKNSLVYIPILGIALANTEKHMVSFRIWCILGFVYPPAMNQTWLAGKPL